MCEKLEAEFEQIKRDRDELRKDILVFNEDIHLPIDMQRLIKNAKETFSVKPRGQTELTPDYVIDRTRKLLDEDIKVYPEHKIKSSSLF